MPTALETIGDNILRLREKKKLTQEALAEKAGVHINTIQRLETASGPNEPTYKTIRKVAFALGVDTSVLSREVR